MILEYECQNQNCPRYEEVVKVQPDETAECEFCGWFMESTRP